MRSEVNESILIRNYLLLNKVFVVTSGKDKKNVT